MRQAMDLQQQQLNGAHELADLQQEARQAQQEALALAKETRKEVADSYDLLLPFLKLVGPVVETGAQIFGAVVLGVFAILVCRFGPGYWGPTLVLFTCECVWSLPSAQH